MVKQATVKITKKTNKFSLKFLTRSRKNFAMFVVVSVFIIAGLAYGALTFAYSTPKRLTICNHPESYAPISIYKGNQASPEHITIFKGGCESLKNNWVRVDVDPRNRGVNSYQLGQMRSKNIRNYDTGPCHMNSRKTNSNPPNNSGKYGVTYRNHKSATCVSCTRFLKST